MVSPARRRAAAVYLVRRHGITEVVATLVPSGWKYTAFRIMTFGMRDHGYEVALVQGLANLKAELEATPQVGPEQTSDRVGDGL